MLNKASWAQHNRLEIPFRKWTKAGESNLCCETFTLKGSGTGPEPENKFGVLVISHHLNNVGVQTEKIHPALHWKLLSLFAYYFSRKLENERGAWPAVRALVNIITVKP